MAWPSRFLDAWWSLVNRVVVDTYRRRPQPADTEADRSVPSVRGGPVLVIGGLGEAMSALDPLTAWLKDLGYDVTPVAVGAGLRCAQETVEVLIDTLDQVATAAGEPVQVVGHSRGGQFARALAPRRPELVAGVVTVGTPFDMLAASAPMQGMTWTIGVLGSMGMPGLYRVECLVGDCCAQFRRAQRRSLPADIPFTSIYSLQDRVVPYRASHDPDARNVVVSGTHVGLLTSHETRRAVAEALTDADARPSGVAA